MTTLVTGSGMIGSCVAKELVERGEKPVLFDVSPRIDYVSDIVSLDKVNLVRGDVLYPSDILDAIKRFGVDRIIHTAGILTVGVKERTYPGFKVNMEGTLNILEIARLSDIESIVFTSSSTVYTGALPRLTSSPMKENFEMNVITDRPRSVYATTKLAGEYLGLNYADEYGLDFKIVRFAAAYGPWRGPPTAHAQLVMMNLVRNLVFGRVQVFDSQYTWSGGTELLFSPDAGLGATLASEAKRPNSKVFNIGGGRLYSMEDVISKAKKLFPNSNIEPPKIQKGLFGYPFEQSQPLDITLAEKELGYHPKFPLERAIESLSEFVLRQDSKASSSA